MHITSEYKIKLLQNFSFCTYFAVTWFTVLSPEKRRHCVVYAIREMRRMPVHLTLLLISQFTKS